MKLERPSDLYVGLLVLAAVAVLVVAFIFTQGWNRPQWDLYMWSTSAQDLNGDTRVELQGLRIGGVKGVVPRTDSATGALRFLVHLRLDEYYQDGTRLALPLGTQAEIVTASALGGATIALRFPEHPVGAMETGDTINSSRRASPLDAIAETADSLKRQFADALEDTRHLVRNLDATVVLAQRELRQTAPAVRGTVTELQTTLTRLEPALERADSLLADAHAGFGPLRDSVTTTLGQARQLVTHLDSLATMASLMASENRETVRSTTHNLYVLSAKLDHFMDQVSRRPLRMITGVSTWRPDSLESPP